MQTLYHALYNRLSILCFFWSLNGDDVVDDDDSEKTPLTISDRRERERKLLLFLFQKKWTKTNVTLMKVPFSRFFPMSSFFILLSSNHKKALATFGLDKVVSSCYSVFFFAFQISTIFLAECTAHYATECESSNITYMEKIGDITGQTDSSLFILPSPTWHSLISFDFHHYYYVATGSIQSRLSLEQKYAINSLLQALSFSSNSTQCLKPFVSFYAQTIWHCLRKVANFLELLCTKRIAVQ